MKRFESAKSFGDHVTADTLVLRGKKDQGINGETNGIVLLDVATGWLDCIATRTKTGDDTYAALTEFAGPRTYVDYFYADGGSELSRAAKDEGWCWGRSAPDLPEANGVA